MTRYSAVGKPVMRQWFDDTFRRGCQYLGVIMVRTLTRVGSSCRAELCRFDGWRDWFVNGGSALSGCQIKDALCKSPGCFKMPSLTDRVVFVCLIFFTCSKNKDVCV